MKHICIVILVLIGIQVLAQSVPQPPGMREGDVLLDKKVWRIIDLNEKQNKPSVWPKSNIVQILYNLAATGKVQVYISDSLSTRMDMEQFVRIGTDTQYVETSIDPDDPSITRLDTVVMPFLPTESITKLMLLEQWYFDSRHGVERPQIIAIAPMYQVEVGGVSFGSRPLCWFRYYYKNPDQQDIRVHLTAHRVFNPSNSRGGISFLDWFQQRLFHSYIIKESNMYDISIMDDPEIKKNGFDALIEAQRLKQEQFQRSNDTNEH
jgi:gliding motility associated protien GldN